MSDHPVEELSPAAEVPIYREPDFDNQEIHEFGHDDGQAVTVIGKMLVSFFLYSLIVMLLVGLWTFRSYKLGSPTDAEPTAAAKH